jgi:hypothetical protein
LSAPADGPFAASGACLCGAVRFGVRGRLPKLGFCHCSQCRKVSGTASNAVIVVKAENFVWLAGEEARQTFRLPSGWSSVFCPTCGSPVPHNGPEAGRYWVPVGLLDGDPALAIAGHIWVASKAAWEVIGDEAPQFAEGPPPR